MKIIITCAILLLTIFIDGCKKPYVYCRSVSMADNFVVSRLSYGYREDLTLVFVVFETEYKTLNSHVHLQMSSKPSGNVVAGQASIVLPDGSLIDLVSSGQAFEYADGVFKQQKIDFSKSQLETYIEGAKSRFSLEAFRRQIAPQESKQKGSVLVK